MIRPSELSLSRRQQDRHVPAFHPGSSVGCRNILHLLENSLDQGASQLGMGYLTTAKRNRELNTLAFSNKAADVLNLEVHIVHRGPRAHLDFLDRVGGRVTLGVVLLLLE